jgi:hypothetical protein
MNVIYKNIKEKITILNSAVLNTDSRSISISHPFNGWSFTSSTTTVSNNQVALSLSSLQLNPDNGFLTFNISHQIVSTTYI